MAKKEQLDTINEYKEISNKQYKLLDVIPKVDNNYDLQQILLDKYLPAPHKSLTILSWMINMVYGTLIMFLIVHFIYSFLKKDWVFISGDFFMLLTAGILMVIVKTHNFIKQYPIFVIIMLVCLVFFIINCVGFQQVLIDQSSHINIAEILKVLQKH